MAQSNHSLIELINNINGGLQAFASAVLDIDPCLVAGEYILLSCHYDELKRIKDSIFVYSAL